MSAEPSLTASLRVGSRLARDGEIWRVATMEAGSLLLAGPGGSRKRALTAALLPDASTRLLGSLQPPQRSRIEP